MLAFKQYLTESEKQYKLRIKTIQPVDDAAMDRIERVCAKYMPIEISRPKKTILQRTPLDFDNALNAEVWIIDLVLALPASPSVLREDIRKALDCAEELVVVRSQFEAIEVETARQNAVLDIEEEADRRGLIPAPLLSDDMTYVEAPGDDDGTEYFGNKYNGALLAYLAKVEDDRPDMRVRANNPMFKWLTAPAPVNEPEMKRNYNYDVPGAPVVKPKSAPPGVKLPDTLLLGGMSDLQKTITRVYTDKNGKKVVLTRKLCED